MQTLYEPVQCIMTLTAADKHNGFVTARLYIQDALRD